MTVTTKSYVDTTLDLTQSFWSPIFQKELRENTMWPALTADPQYKAEEVKGGDTLKIKRINKPTTNIKTIGTDADSFESNVLSTTNVDLVVNKRCTSAYEFEDLAILMSQLEQKDSEIKESLLSDVQEQANDWIKSLIVPSASDPDHTNISASGDFNLAALSNARTLASVAKWSTRNPWMLVLDPTFTSDLLDDTTVASSSFTGENTSPIINGAFQTKRMNYNILEDNSLATDTGFAITRGGLVSVMGTPRFKISDLHAQKKFGYLLSVDFVLGAAVIDNKRLISFIV